MSESSKGPWFGAQYPGECGTCFNRFEEGDQIRADGEGGWECEAWCGQDDEVEPVRPRWDPEAQDACDVCGITNGAHGGWCRKPLSDPASTVDVMDDFSDPSPARGPQGGGVAGAPSAEEFLDPGPELNVSGQPKARYEGRGKVNMGYLVKDPVTGDFHRYKNEKPKGLTRATTFNKAASDSKAINDWGKRNVVIGASRRPDIIDRADGLTHETDRDALNAIVAELEEAAGAKVSADIGTALHAFTEQMDAGLKAPADAPARYRAQLELYQAALAEAGFEPVPGLIERTTMVREFGGVVGTFDRIFYHRPSDSYMIGDLKTGKTMEYAMDETQTQMWLYAHGVNQNGIYDWNTDEWVNPVWDDRENYDAKSLVIREDVGVIIHMPVQGELAGQVILDRADLRAGAEHAKLCHAIRSRHKSKVVAWSNDDVVPAPVQGEVAADLAYVPVYGGVNLWGWRTSFESAQTREEARELYDRAHVAGVPEVDLQAMASDALNRLG